MKDIESWEEREEMAANKRWQKDQEDDVCTRERRTKMKLLGIKKGQEKKASKTSLMMSQILITPPLFQILQKRGMQGFKTSPNPKQDQKHSSHSLRDVF